MSIRSRRAVAANMRNATPSQSGRAVEACKVI
jgi:hypothetical protein